MMKKLALVLAGLLALAGIAGAAEAPPAANPQGETKKWS